MQADGIMSTKVQSSYRGQILNLVKKQIMEIIEQSKVRRINNQKIGRLKDHISVKKMEGEWDRTLVKNISLWAEYDAS